MQNAAAMRPEFWRGMKEAVPVILGLVPFALVLGASGVKSGMAVWQVPLMTGTNFAGGSEFAAVSLWGNPVNIGLVVLMSVLVNSRHLVMSLAFSPLLAGVPRKQALAALYFMCDEAWAMGIAEARRHHRTQLNLPYYFGVSCHLYLAWVVFTAAGALLGPLLGNLDAYGFDMAFTAVFLVLLRGMWRGILPAIPWLVSLAVAGGMYHAFDGAWYVAGGAVSGMLAAFWRREKV
ncbi:AzlC family ABC transporter permease [Neisseria leonii]|uniref:AzlC family ABC transporter permease n=1 Tax=Neisseria leonii TaxID=2995413 RepID=A0A9X4E7B7_9NEIS|nr:AzlC family ABC transporter permease [Neisseria sp. 51.81]MDD9328427.1 AzlC family ABC transporter permease [Neisseria sp. 51.81]